MKNLKIILIFVTTLFLASCSKDDAPVVTPAPTSNLAISSINPTSGPKNTTVFLTGVDFSPNILSNAVILNGKACTVNTASTTILSITIPRGAGSGLINVTVAGTTVQTPNFEYVITPSVVSTFAGSTVGFADGTGNVAQFSGPSGVAVDASGNLYVADNGNHKIRKISPTGAVITLAGGTAGFADGTGNVAQFVWPAGIAIDASGNVYVSEEGNNKIRKISPSVAVTTLAGSSEGFADGTGSLAQFKTPYGAAVDASGNVYVADTRNNRIRKVSPSGVVTTFAGSNGGFANGTGTAAKFDRPYGVAVDLSGNVYVADSWNHKIRKISPDGVVTTLAGSIAGFADGTGIAAQFTFPCGIAVDATGNVYVGEDGNSKIRKISLTGVVTTLAGTTGGFADGLSTVAQFSRPSGLAVDATGNVYVADQENHKIRKITQD